MRSFIIGCVVASSLSLGACAHSSGARPINVHAVRVDIKDTINANPGAPGPRAIVSMGKVTADSAVVYTQATGGARREETWVKQGGAWALTDAREIAAANMHAAQ